MPERSERLSVRSGIRQPRGQVSARIRRDSFRRAGGGEQLEQVARSLAEFNDSFSRLASTHLQRRAEENREKGRLALQNAAEDQKAWREMVRDGDVPASSNPHYQAGVHMEAGKRAANRFNSFLMAKVDEELGTIEDGKLKITGTTLEEFDRVAAEAMDEFVEENVGEENRTEAFDTGFSARAQAFIGNQRSAYASGMTERLKRQDAQHFGAVVFSDVRREWTKGTDPEVIASGIATALDEKAQIDPSNTGGRNRAVVRAVVDAAVAEQDQAMLGVLDHLKTGPQDQENRPSLSATDFARDRIRKAREVIAQKNQEERDNAWKRKNRERQRVVEEVYTGVTNALQEASDPQSVDLDPHIDRLESVGAAHRVTTLRSIKRNYVQDAFEEDKTAVRAAWHRIYTAQSQDDPRYFDQEDAHSMLAAGTVTPRTHSQLLTALEERAEGGPGTPQDLMDNEFLTDGIQAIESRFGNEFGSFSGTAAAIRAERAENFFTRRYGRWLQNNPDADLNELTETRERMVDEAWRIFSAEGTKSAVAEEPDPVEPSLSLRGGPQPVDWEEETVTDRQADLQRLNREWQAIQEGTRSTFSDYAWAILRAAGSPPPEDFINAQAQLWAGRLDN